MRLLIFFSFIHFSFLNNGFGYFLNSSKGIDQSGVLPKIIEKSTLIINPVYHQSSSNRKFRIKTVIAINSRVIENILQEIDGFSWHFFLFSLSKGKPVRLGAGQYEIQFQFDLLRLFFPADLFKYLDNNVTKPILSGSKIHPDISRNYYFPEIFKNLKYWKWKWRDKGQEKLEIYRNSLKLMIGWMKGPFLGAFFSLKEKKEDDPANLLFIGCLEVY